MHPLRLRPRADQPGFFRKQDAAKVGFARDPRKTFLRVEPAGEELIKTRQNDIANSRETILLVDDEAYIRELVGAILAVEGYQVLEAGNGQEAMAVAEAYIQPIHLLLTDVVMSPMGGGELVKRLLPLRPGLKVLYISGYPDDCAAREGMESLQVSFLAKPFSPKTLVRSVRAVLDQVTASA